MVTFRPSVVLTRADHHTTCYFMSTRYVIYVGRNGTDVSVRVSLTPKGAPNIRALCVMNTSSSSGKLCTTKARESDHGICCFLLCDVHRRWHWRALSGAKRHPLVCAVAAHQPAHQPDCAGPLAEPEHHRPGRHRCTQPRHPCEVPGLQRACVERRSRVQTLQLQARSPALSLELRVQPRQCLHLVVVSRGLGVHNTLRCCHQPWQQARRGLSHTPKRNLESMQ